MKRSKSAAHRAALLAWLALAVVCLAGLGGCARKTPVPPAAPGAPREVRVTAQGKTAVYAGRFAAGIGAIVIQEETTGSLGEGDIIRLVLPQGLSWNRVPVPQVQKGDVVVGAGAVVAGTEGTVAEYRVLGTAQAGKSIVALRSGTVSVPLGHPAGDLAVEVVGPQQLKGTVVVAHISSPIEIQAGEAPRVVAGKQDQAGADISIVESGEGALMARPRGEKGQLVIVTPPGVRFSRNPTVEVVQGDLVLDSARVAVESGRNSVLTVPVAYSSTVPSTIRIGNVTLTLDRTVPQGPVMLTIGGSAVDEIGLGAPFAVATEASVAECVTAALGKIPLQAEFRIGTAGYRLNELEVPMDTPAEVKGGVVYLPARALAQALGVTEGNVLWDSEKKTVTLLRGDRVVQAEVGLRALVINGLSVPMQATAEMTAGRVMLPAEPVARAFGAQYSFDPDTGIVKISS